MTKLLSRNRGPNRGLPTSCFGIPSPILLVVPLPMLGEEGQSPPRAFAPKGGWEHRLDKWGCQSPLTLPPSLTLQAKARSQMTTGHERLGLR